MNNHQIKNSKAAPVVTMIFKRIVPVMILLVVMGSLTARADIRTDMANSNLTLVAVFENGLASGMDVGSVVAEMIAAEPSQANSSIATAMVVAPENYQQIILAAINTGVAPEAVVAVLLISSDGVNAANIVEAVVNAAPASARDSIQSAAVAALPSTGSALVQASAPSAVPEFPAKPPRPSASYTLKNSQLLDFTWDDVQEPLDLPTSLQFSGSCEDLGDACPVLTLGVIGARLQAALEVAEFEQQYSFYKYRDDGFALVTSVEHIKDDGSSYDPKEFVGQPVGSFSLRNALQSILAGEPEADSATYRMLVFVSSADRLEFSDTTLTSLDARNFVDNGYSEMPEPVAVMPFTPRHRVYVLSYQFERTTFRVSLKTDRVIAASKHVEQLALDRTLAEKEDFEMMDYRPGQNCRFDEAFGIAPMEIHDGDLPGLSTTSDIPNPDAWQKNFRKTFPVKVSQTYGSFLITNDSEERSLLEATYCVMVQCADAERTKRFANYQIGLLKKHLRRARQDEDAEKRLTDASVLMQSAEANLQMCQRVLTHLESIGSPVRD